MCRYIPPILTGVHSKEKKKPLESDEDLGEFHKNHFTKDKLKENTRTTILAILKYFVKNKEDFIADDELAHLKEPPAAPTLDNVPVKFLKDATRSCLGKRPVHTMVRAMTTRVTTRSLKITSKTMILQRKLRRYPLLHEDFQGIQNLKNPPRRFPRNPKSFKCPTSPRSIVVFLMFKLY